MNCHLNFNGYWSIDQAGVANYSGIYCVYISATPATNATSYLLYIGESSNIGYRILNHERRLDWIASARYHPLCFNACHEADMQVRQHAEAAMIYHHQPLCNVEFKTHFPYGTITVTTSGKNANLSPGFIIR